MMSFLTTGSAIVAGFLLLMPQAMGDTKMAEKVSYELAQDGVKIEGKIFRELDPASFQMVNSYYAKDRQGVYWLRRPKSLGNPAVFLEPVPQADSTTFVTVSGAEDDSYGELGKDAKHVYSLGKVLSSDPTHFQALSHGYTKDKQHVYLHGAKSSLDSASVVILSDQYQKDKRGIIYRDHALVKGADANSFSSMGSDGKAMARYGRDNHSVFYDDTLVPGAAPKSFVGLDDVFGADALHVYARHQKLDLADRQSFQPLGKGYAVDAKNVFYEGQHLHKADRASFRVVVDRKRLADFDWQPLAEDKTHIYVQGVTKKRSLFDRWRP